MIFYICMFDLEDRQYKGDALKISVRLRRIICIYCICFLSIRQQHIDTSVKIPLK